MAPRVPTATKQAILAALAAGETQADVATRFGVHWTYPGILRRRGIRPGSVDLTDEQQQQVAREFSAGLPRKEIARRHGISEICVTRTARRAGCAPRKVILPREAARA